MRTKLSVRPQMSINPQLVMAGQLLQVPGSDLEQFINRELTDNPALELVNKADLIKENLQSAKYCYAGGSYSTTFWRGAPNELSSFERIIENVPQTQSPLEKLAEQVSLLVFSKSDRDLAISLLHRLDHRGFLVIQAEQVACELEVSHEAVTRAIRLLHQLDPPGIGARGIRECFLIQCTHLEAQGIDCGQVRKILTMAWSEFLNRQWARVARKVREPKKIVEDACEFMRLNFYPHPLAILETSRAGDKVLQHTDLIIKQNRSGNTLTYSLEIPDEEEFELKTATSFQKILGSESQEEVGLSAQERTWVRYHLERASMVIAALKQRWQTLRQIGEYLMQYQKDFLEDGPLHLKPLTRAAVAQKLHIHESTVGRAVSHKVIQLPNGRLMPLSDFFDPSLAAKEAIRQLLISDSKHRCDREIAEDLQANGMNISRRTITKYRRELNLGSTRRQSLAI